MKTAAKVFLIIRIIFSFYLIYPLVLGIIACKKLDECKDIKEIHKWGIICLILVSLIGGIIMLVMKEEAPILLELQFDQLMMNAIALALKHSLLKMFLKCIKLKIKKILVMQLFKKK